MARYAQAGPTLSAAEEVSEKAFRDAPRYPRNTGVLLLRRSSRNTGRASDFLLFLPSCLLFGFLDSTEPFEMPKFDLIWNIKGSYLWPLTFKGSVYTITDTNKASPIARGSCVYSPSYPPPPENRANFRKLFLLRLHSSSSSRDKLCLVSVFKTFAMRFRRCCFCVFFFLTTTITCVKAWNVL